MSLPGRLSLGAAHHSGDGANQVRQTQIVKTARSMSSSMTSDSTKPATSVSGKSTSESGGKFVERDTSQMSAEEARAYHKAKKKAAKEERKRRAAEKKLSKQQNPTQSQQQSSARKKGSDAKKKAGGSSGSPSQTSLKKSMTSAKNPSGHFRRKSSTVLPQFDDPSIRKQMKRQAVIKRIPVENSKRIGMFSHLPQFEREFYLSLSAKEIHPAVIRLGYYFCDDVITGANARCIGMLNAFKQVIKDYKSAKHVDLKHDLLSKVNPCIQFLNDCRPLSVSMRNAIRWFKSFINIVTAQYYSSHMEFEDEIKESATLLSSSSSKHRHSSAKSHLRQAMMGGGGHRGRDHRSSTTKTAGKSGKMTEQDVKRKICKHIDEFIQNKIELADKEISANVCSRIKDGDIILTHAHSFVIEKSLIDAHNQGKQFSVIIVDSRPLMEGRRLLEKLVKCGLHCTYTLINGLSYTLNSNGVTKVFLGASSVLSNGYIMSRVGTAMIALMSSQSYKIPVTVCCETYKFSERVQIDSICANEIGDADNITKPIHGSFNSSKRELDEWRSMNGLKLVNLKYDITPPHFVTMIITECGAIPPTSAPVIIREFHRDREFV